MMEWIIRALLISALAGMLSMRTAASPSANETCTTENAETSTLSPNGLSHTNSTNASMDREFVTEVNSTEKSQALRDKEPEPEESNNSESRTSLTSSTTFKYSSLETTVDTFSKSSPVESTEATVVKSEEPKSRRDYVESASRSEMEVSETKDSDKTSTPEYNSENLMQADDPDSGVKSEIVGSTGPPDSEPNGTPQNSEMNNSSAGSNLRDESSKDSGHSSEDTSPTEDLSTISTDPNSSPSHSAVRRSAEARTLSLNEISSPDKTTAGDQMQHTRMMTTESHTQTDGMQNGVTVLPTSQTKNSEIFTAATNVSEEYRYDNDSESITSVRPRAEYAASSEPVQYSPSESIDDAEYEMVSGSSINPDTSAASNPKDSGNKVSDALIHQDVSNISEYHSTPYEDISDTKSDGTEDKSVESVKDKQEATTEGTDSKMADKLSMEDSTLSTRLVAESETEQSLENTSKNVHETSETDNPKNERNESESISENTNSRPAIRSRGERSSDSKLSEVRKPPSEVTVFPDDSAADKRNPSVSPTPESHVPPEASSEVIRSNSATDGNVIGKELESTLKAKYSDTDSAENSSSGPVTVNTFDDAHSNSEVMAETKHSVVYAVLPDSPLMKDNDDTNSSFESVFSINTLDHNTEVTTGISRDYTEDEGGTEKSSLSQPKMIITPETLSGKIDLGTGVSSHDGLSMAGSSPPSTDQRKPEESSEMKSVEVFSPSSKPKSIHENSSESVMNSEPINISSIQSGSFEQQNSDPLSESQKSVSESIPISRVGDILMNDSPSEYLDARPVKDNENKNGNAQDEKKQGDRIWHGSGSNQGENNKEGFSDSQRLDEDTSSQRGSEVPVLPPQTIPRLPVAVPTVIQPASILEDNDSIVRNTTENRAKLTAADSETSDIVESGESFPSQPLIPFSIHSTSLPTKVTTIPVDSASEAILISAVSNGENAFHLMFSTEPSKEESEQKIAPISGDNASPTIIMPQSENPAAFPLGEAANSTATESKDLGPLVSKQEDEKTGLAKPQSSEMPIPSTEAPPVDLTNSSSTEATTTRRSFAIRKPRIRMNGESDTLSTVPFTRKTTTTTRRPTTEKSGGPVSIFRRNRTRLGSITSSTTPRTTAAYSVRRASIRPVLIVGTEAFSFSLPPTTTVPTTTEFEEEEEEEEEEVVELEEDHLSEQNQAPTISEDQEVTLIKFSASMVVRKGIRWKKQLNSRPSPEYKREEKRMRQTLETIFRGSPIGPKFWKIEIDGFSEKYPRSRSITVDYFLYLLKTGNPPDSVDLIEAFNQRLVNDTFSRYTFAPDFAIIEFFSEVTLNKPTESPEQEPPIPQWAIAVIVIGAASFIFIVLFAAVTVYGRHHMRRRYTSKLDDDLERSVDSREWEKKLGAAAAYENLAADVVYDVDDSGSGVENAKRQKYVPPNPPRNPRMKHYDSWRTDWTVPPKRARLPINHIVF